MTDEANQADYLKNSPNPNEVQTSGEDEADSSGFLHMGGALLMNISPEHGNGLLVPWSRLEKIEVNNDATEIVLYVSDAVVVVRAQNTAPLIRALQTASVYSLTEGQNNKNNVVIESIAITFASDRE